MFGVLLFGGKHVPMRSTKTTICGINRLADRRNGTMRMLQQNGIGSIDEKKHNCVQKSREEKMMSKAELARTAGVTVQTIDRIEKGFDCRMDTKRKILLALGYQLVDRNKLFFDSN
jgi:DNA-binding XRE family transcriptional regulator